ncbi:GCN5-related N-acetyltransferase 3, chloroplastic-like isoform X2 [Actinidia eriantha]|uniref:GCN5-related N-acetyltransferase 3, chloroplastic-like isoform X2 n=1 Tax=Actinidia eriantha TaxID=165200 RepID=UPI00258EB341|nr:GCN5-related N-acetyltransferase 3, chloroplastic-like isoform X2 [Actinidia eriantha]
MAVAAGVHGAVLPIKLWPSPTKITAANHGGKRRPRPPPLPIFISTNPNDINPHRLTDLYGLCNHSCHRFPAVSPDGRAEPVDMAKLRIALSHSSVVVSVFAKAEAVPSYSPPRSSDSSSEVSDLMGLGGEWFRRVVPLTPSNGRLVGFGRAVGDCGLTASIYDVMVIPSLRGMGIGRMIVRRIIRVLTSRGIYDIAALCSDEERLFFEACGFGDDTLGSTTMMYTKTVSSYEANQVVKRVGRKLLLAPPERKPFKS